MHDPTSVEIASVLGTFGCIVKRAHAAVLLMLFCNHAAFGALRREGLLGFGVGWRASFIAVATRTSGFFRTVTQRMGTRSNKAAKIKGVIRFHSALARRIHQRPQDLTSKGDKTFGWLRPLTRSEGILFEEFKFYVACKYSDHCDNTVNNVSTPPRHLWIDESWHGVPHGALLSGTHPYPCVSLLPSAI